MPMYGADVAALRTLAAALRHRQEELEATRRRLTTVVGGLPWTGDDHDRFVDEWHRVHDPSLADVAADLGDSSRRARYHAQRQAEASRRR